MVDFNVNGKVAVVTGGTRGLGLYCAEAFVLNGAKTVVISSRKTEACEESKAHLEKLAKDNGRTCNIIGIAADVSKETECNKLYEETKKHVDKVDILIANAGATWGAPIGEHPIPAMHKVLSLNIIGVFNCIQLFKPDLEAAGTPEDPARVIIMSSIVSLVSADAAGVYGYSASKAGVSHMGKSLAIQLGPKNINVNSLAPGFIPSNMSKGLIDIGGEFMVALNPRKRLGNADDIKNSVLFLCSQQSNYINGVVLPLDGGAYLNSAIPNL